MLLQGHALCEGQEGSSLSACLWWIYLSSPISCTTVTFECLSACVHVLRDGRRVSSHQYMQVNGNIQAYEIGSVGKEFKKVT